MTTPTGRPRGRPKTKEYVTLMARVPQELADRVQRYAGLHQQPISVVLRDALEVLLEEDRYHPFLSDMNRASDTLSDTKAESARIMSDRKEAQADIVSDMNADTPAPRAVTPPRTRSAKVSDTKEVEPAILSDMKEDVPPIVSYTKGDDRTPDGHEIPPAMMSDTKADQAESPPEPAILSDTNIPAFDTSKYSLGKLCPRGHAHGTTGQSLLRISNRHCILCDREKWHEKYGPRRQAKRQA